MVKSSSKSKSKPASKWYVKVRCKNPDGSLGEPVAQLPKSYATQAGAAKAGQKIADGYEVPAGCVVVAEQGNSKRGNPGGYHTSMGVKFRDGNPPGLRIVARYKAGDGELAQILLNGGVYYVQFNYPGGSHSPGGHATTEAGARKLIPSGFHKVKGPR